jgi:hypothetical protein
MCIDGKNCFCGKKKKIHHSEISVTHPQIANPTKIGEKIECLFYKKNWFKLYLKVDGSLHSLK